MNQFPWLSGDSTLPIGCYGKGDNAVVDAGLIQHPDIRGQWDMAFHGHGSQKKCSLYRVHVTSLHIAMGIPLGSPPRYQGAKPGFQDDCGWTVATPKNGRVPPPFTWGLEFFFCTVNSFPNNSTLSPVLLCHFIYDWHMIFTISMQSFKKRYRGYTMQGAWGKIQGYGYDKMNQDKDKARWPFCRQEVSRTKGGEWNQGRRVCGTSYIKQLSTIV